ncbi:Uncharacterised protein [Brevundimonas diminuta]|jgi:hypothetical protein|uniref:Integral membrane protein n=3 Tax=Pseudomonadota TaxID=1224 RepID=A0A246KF90_BREDI|nr:MULTISPECIES: hypothetical protein [Brevundimonas]OJU53440.1 MAG: hypothetical protein BGO02_00165 [Brevundimonas sp. 67-6]ASD26586.1 hypothetical protein CD943_06585 [Brevundimonas diminuta]EGF95729.1 putative membrane protein [Brevundimonas diminuta ATCC 11568]MBD3571470.1 hypothetical protein [Brevundimonas diminuta]MBD3819989.1 hypothetical protein [Brevundimonas diminuta]
MSPIFLFTIILLAVATGLALVRGGPWERAVAIAIIVAGVISAVAPFDHRSPPWFAIGADAGVFLLLLYGVVSSGRRWLIAAAGFQFLVLATHYAFASNLQLEQWGYISAYYVWNIGVIGSLMIGSLTRRRSRSRV